MTVSKVAVGSVLKSRNQIIHALSTPTWDVNELYKKDSESVHSTPDASLLTKLLKQCGLRPADYSPDRQQKLLNELATQLTFVEHISAVDTTGIPPLVRMGGGTDPEFRLDHAKEAASYAPETVGDSSWDPTSLASARSGKFYVVNEGLRHE